METGTTTTTTTTSDDILTAKDLLQIATDLVHGDRPRDYGMPAENVERITGIWKQILGIDITPRQFCWMMIAMKMARDVAAPKDDNMIDTVGYVMFNQIIESGQDVTT